MNRRRVLTFGLGGLALLAVAGFAVWFFLIRGDAPPPVAIESAVEELTGAATTAPGRGTDAAPTTVATAPGATSAAATGADGSWTVDTGAGSFVGYRVEEELARIGATTAVGRTTGVTGTLVVDGTTVPTVEIEADLTGLTSDESRRDRAIRTQALETDRFPTATFRLTEPIDFGAVPAAGETVGATATGELTLHGVTRTVDIPIEAQFTGDVIAVVGSLPIQFADHDIDSPSSFVVLSVDDNGIMEFQLFFTRAS